MAFRDWAVTGRQRAGGWGGAVPENEMPMAAPIVRFRFGALVRLLRRSSCLLTPLRCRAFLYAPFATILATLAVLAADVCPCPQGTTGAP